ncbi:M66 family metalloprotease [Thaumasiovibrio subtropicus]|uniref:M66 family metalloprotease n=1 Tax=Thaumasiovibrio subtropicus TaxID=1891207 RepID=UPI000B35BE4B|nr:M66 family metalloprotease [Thaumasiovibrio subtropicus]
MRLNVIARSIRYGLIGAVFSAPIYTTYAAEAEVNVDNSPIYFNQKSLDNMLEGNLRGGVIFGQNVLFEAKNNEDDIRQHLVGQRDTLVLFKPENVDASETVVMTVKDGSGAVLYRTEMTQPDALPGIAGAVSGDMPDVDLPEEYDYVINSKSELEELRGDTKGTKILSILNQHNSLKIKLADGLWIPEIYFPDSTSIGGKLISVESDAGFSTQVVFGQDSVTIQRGEQVDFSHNGSSWYFEDLVSYSRFAYGERFWSADIDGAFIQNNMSIAFSSGELSGELSNFHVGAATELILATLDLGLLTPYRGEFDFQYDEELHRQYYQTIPVSKLVVTEYEPQHLEEVVLSKGTRYTDHSSDNGDLYAGDMRNDVGMYLFGLGIGNANNGVNSSRPGIGAWNEPGYTAQTTVQNSIGNYANGIQPHGYNARVGSAVVYSSKGNEFSHELGHSYALPHYNGGFAGSVHRPAKDPNSTWGWDANRRLFVPNFERTISNEETCVDNSLTDTNGSVGKGDFECLEPLDGRSFGLDAMAGGQPMVPSVNNYTLHTPLPLARSQYFFEKRAIFDKNSSTGFRKWNFDLGVEEEWSHMVQHRPFVDAWIYIVNQGRISEYFDRNSVVRVRVTFDPKPLEMPKAADYDSKVLEYVNDSNRDAVIMINDEVSIEVPKGETLHLVSNNGSWINADSDVKLDQKAPIKQGIPVTTLLGFYDPESEIDAYVYPGLHGSYGHVYSGDETVYGCYLSVVFKDGTEQKHQLQNERFSSSLMNRFHVNVETALEPVSATVICDGKTQATREISKPTKALRYTINGVVQGADGGISADAGVDQVIYGAGTVVLDGSNSQGDDVLRYEWQQLSGPAVELVDANSAIARFDVDGGNAEYQFKLTVTEGEQSAFDTVKVTVVDSHLPPSIDLEDLYRVESGETLSITAGIEASSAVTLNWAISDDVTFTGQGTDTITVTAPTVTADTYYTITLDVTDEHAQSTTASSLLEVSVADTDICRPTTDKDADNYPEWQPQSYGTANTLVSHQQLVWKNKWYASEGEEPGIAGVWELVSDVMPLWQSQRTYSAGDEVHHANAEWRASAWIAAGQAPGDAAAWVKVTDCE